MENRILNFRVRKFKFLIEEINYFFSSQNSRFGTSLSGIALCYQQRRNKERGWVLSLTLIDKSALYEGVEGEFTWF